MTFSLRQHSFKKSNNFWFNLLSLDQFLTIFNPDFNENIQILENKYQKSWKNQEIYRGDFFCIPNKQAGTPSI